MPLKLVGRIESILSLSYSHLPEFVWMYLQCKDPRALRALNHKHWSSGTNLTACGYFKDLLEPCIQMEKYFCCSWSRSTRASRLMLENGQKKIQIIQSKKKKKPTEQQKQQQQKQPEIKPVMFHLLQGKLKLCNGVVAPKEHFFNWGGDPYWVALSASCAKINTIFVWNRCNFFFHTVVKINSLKWTERKKLIWSLAKQMPILDL